MMKRVFFGLLACVILLCALSVSVSASDYAQATVRIASFDYSDGEYIMSNSTSLYVNQISIPAQPLKVGQQFYILLWAAFPSFYNGSVYSSGYNCAFTGNATVATSSNCSATVTRNSYCIFVNVTVTADTGSNEMLPINVYLNGLSINVADPSGGYVQKPIVHLNVTQSLAKLFGILDQFQTTLSSIDTHTQSIDTKLTTTNNRISTVNNNITSFKTLFTDWRDNYFTWYAGEMIVFRQRLTEQKKFSYQSIEYDQDGNATTAIVDNVTWYESLLNTLNAMAAPVAQQVQREQQAKDAGAEDALDLAYDSVGSSFGSLGDLSGLGDLGSFDGDTMGEHGEQSLLTWFSIQTANSIDAVPRNKEPNDIVDFYTGKIEYYREEVSLEDGATAP